MSDERRISERMRLASTDKAIPAWIGTLLAGYADEVAAAEAQVAVLGEALKPFADFAPHRDTLPDDMRITAGSDFAKKQLTIGDLRKAKAAHASLPAQASELIAERDRLKNIVALANRTVAESESLIAWLRANDPGRAIIALSAALRSLGNTDSE